MEAPRRSNVLTSLIFPTFNPGPRIDTSWLEIQRFLAESPRRWEVIFVCDGCTDGTADRLAQLTRGESRHVRVISYQPNRGKGFAIRRGLTAARGAWRIFTDVDLAYPWSDVLTVAESLWAGADVVAGSRSHPDSRVVLPPSLSGYVYFRHLQSMMFGGLVRRLLPLEQRDTQAGLKGLSAASVRRLLPYLHCDGFGFDCELLTACVRLGVPVTELPVHVRCDDAVSTIGFRAALATLRELWQVRQVWKRMPMSRRALRLEAVPFIPKEAPVCPHLAG